MKIPANTLILVADGRKAMILRNAGDERFPNLTNEWVVVDQNPPTSLQGTDRPGRSNYQGRRSSFEQTDWHAEREDAFAKRAAEAFESLARESQTRHLVIVAPPRTLAVLRRSVSGSATRKVIAELPQDLVNLSVGEIETHLDRTEAISL